jgi:hypothetical protein
LAPELIVVPFLPVGRILRLARPFLARGWRRSRRRSPPLGCALVVREPSPISLLYL